VYKDNLREWDLKTPYQIDFYDKDFQFLKSVDIPDNRRLRGIDSSERVYFIENEPFPRIIRSRVTVKDKS
jgi:hypothetical protein